MISRLTFAIAAAASILFSGCASIVTGQNQALSVEAIAPNGSQVSGANCRLANDKGTWFVVTPGSATVTRSYNDINVSCSRDGHEPGILVAKSSTKAMAAGNILFGGIIGAAVDAGTGAAFDYPSLIRVIMGRSISVTAEAEQSGERK